MIGFYLKEPFHRKWALSIQHDSFVLWCCEWQLLQAFVQVQVIISFWSLTTTLERHPEICGCKAQSCVSLWFLWVSKALKSRIEVRIRDESFNGYIEHFTAVQESFTNFMAQSFVLYGVVRPFPEEFRSGFILFWWRVYYWNFALGHSWEQVCLYYFQQN